MGEGPGGTDDGEIQRQKRYIRMQAIEAARRDVERLTRRVEALMAERRRLLNGAPERPTDR